MRKGDYVMRGDPYWLSVKCPSKCVKCGGNILPKDRALFFPVGRELYGARCGCANDALRKFSLDVEHEENYSDK